MLIAIIVIVVLVALVGFVIIGFNKLRTSDIGAQEALGGIDVQLTRRADLIPNLVETVKGYAAHESEVFEEVTKARAGLAAAAGRRRPGQGRRRRRAQPGAGPGQRGRRGLPRPQGQPELPRAPGQLTDTENQISFARQYYNDAVATLNKLVADDPVDVLLRHRQRAQARVLRGPRRPGRRPHGSF